jgi:Meckelin (Transmembrane protein 67)
MNTFKVVIIIFIVIFAILFLLVTISRIYINTKYYPKGCDHIYGTSRMSTLVQLSIWIIIENLGIFIYVYLIGLTGFWYMFFKWQKGAVVLLGSPSFEASSYRIFYGFFWVCFALVLISNMIRIYKGAKVDILLIDWEKEKFLKMRSAVKLNKDVDEIEGESLRLLLKSNKRYKKRI